MVSYYPNNFYQNSFPQQAPSLLGKVVENIDAVKACEIPFGGYGIYPKGDFSEIYIKTWNGDGTTRINKYQPVQITPEEEVDTNALLVEKINSLEEKINSLIEHKQSTPEEIKSYGY